MWEIADSMCRRASVRRRAGASGLDVVSLLETPSLETILSVLDASVFTAGACPLRVVAAAAGHIRCDAR
jgi:hypothetical protein